MPRVPLHALIWSSDQRQYELYTQGQLEQRFRPADEAAWLTWLGEAASFPWPHPGMAWREIAAPCIHYRQAMKRSSKS